MHEKDAPIPTQLEDLLDSGIDHIMLIGKSGRVESMASNSEIRLSKEKQEIFSMGFRLHHSLLQEFDDEFGPVEQFVIWRKNAKILSIPFGSRNLIFIMDNRYDHTSIIEKTRGGKSRDFNMPEMSPLCAGVIPSG